jgi:hypothetical protein
MSVIDFEKEFLASPSLNSLEKSELIKLKELCELRILELLDWQNTSEFTNLCSKYVDISTLLPFQLKTDEDVYNIFKLIIFGYLANRSQSVKDFLNQHDLNNNLDLDVTKWNSYLFRQIFKAFATLVLFESQDDILSSIDLINQLRAEQKQFELPYLKKLEEEYKPNKALEIVSFYYFAKVVELLAQCLLESEIQNQNDIKNKISNYIDKAKEFANYSGNKMIELIYIYVKTFSIEFFKRNENYQRLIEI